VKTLLILNDPPYGTERCYNALRLAHSVQKHDPAGEITIFLMADAVVGARKGQKVPEGYYSIERMLRRVVAAKGRVLLCGSCMDARGVAEGDLLEGAQRSTMDELAATTAAADKLLVF